MSHADVSHSKAVHVYETISVESKWKLRVKIGAIVGLCALIYLLITNPTAAWVSMLVDSYYFTGVGVLALFFVALGRVSTSAWWVPFRRVPEVVSSVVPMAAILLLLSLIGMHTIYEWSHHEEMLNDPILIKKIAWLNPVGFIIRMVAILGTWSLFYWKFSNIRQTEDTHTPKQNAARWVKWSAIFIVAFVVTWNVASFDWIMSIEPHWFSTIYAVYCFVGAFVNAIAVITMTLVILRRWGYFAEINENHFHDLGKMLFAFSTFWMYIWLCQYILIWYANIPEETMHYVSRGMEGWDWLVYYANPAMNWIIPFFWLLPRQTKRTPDMLFKVCVVFLVGRWFDIFLLVAPKVYANAGLKDPTIGIADVLVAVGFASMFGYVIIHKLEKNKIKNENDAYYKEGLALEQ